MSDGNQPETRSKPAAGLYLVATPIGNARDITLRALDLLRDCDVVACEDTRVTSKLFAIYGLSNRLISYHDHNADRMRPQILHRIGQGQAVALVSDAGMPLISDPGFKLVQTVREAGFAVTAAPGASASLTALILSGLPSDRFLFAGFLEPRATARRRALQDLAAVPSTLVFYESGRRLSACLKDMATVLGDREAAVTRELTKKFEEIRRGRLNVLADHYTGIEPPKGEIVLVVGAPEAAIEAPPLDILLTEALERFSLRDAADQVAAATGRNRRSVYARALELNRK